MALKIHIRMESVAKALQELKEGIVEDLVEIVEDEMREALADAPALAVALGKVGAGNPSHYAANFKLERDGRKFTLVNTSEYAEVLEYGAPPHYPPLEPLIEWVEAKFGLGGEEAVAVAVRVQKSIGVRGFPAGEVPRIMNTLMDRARANVRRRIREYRIKHSLGTTRAWGRVRTRYGAKGTYTKGGVKIR